MRHDFGPLSKLLPFSDVWATVLAKHDPEAGVIELPYRDFILDGLWIMRTDTRDELERLGIKTAYLVNEKDGDYYVCENVEGALLDGFLDYVLTDTGSWEGRWHIPLVLRFSHRNADDSVKVDKPTRRTKPKGTTPWIGTGFRTATIRDYDSLYEAVAYHMQSDEFVFDVETEGSRPKRGKDDKPPLDARTNQVVWLSIATAGRCDVIPMGHPDGPKQLDVAEVFAALEPLFFSDRRKVNQNVKFDLMSIAKYYGGRVPPGPYGDTATLIFLLNENLQSYKLGDLIKHYFHFSYRKVAAEGNPITSYPFDEVALYSFLDSRWTWLLWHNKIRLLRAKEKLSALFDMEMDLLPALMDMNRRGALVDPGGFEELRTELEPQIARVEEDIYRAAGRRFLITSQQQKAKLLYGKDEGDLKLRCHSFTEKGAPQVSEAALLPLIHRHPVVPLLLQHAELKKHYATYVTGFQQHIEDDGRIRASFNPQGAKTGRFSCSGPNLQNIPRENE